MNTLFINLTRFGDLLQTQPALSAMAREGRRTGLLCLENFAPASRLLRDLHHVHPMPGARILALLDSDWNQALLLHRDTGRACVKDFSPACVVGLTATLSARLLARQLRLAAAALGQPMPDILGFGLDAHGFSTSSSLWAVFLQAATKKRGCSPFNVVDLFCRSAGLQAPPWANELARPSDPTMQAAASILGPLPAGLAGFVGLQLGASQDRRRWPVSSFARLGELLSRELGLLPVLLGSPGERHLAERYLALGAPGVDCVGKTGLEELAAVVSRCSLVVSNDTGTMHLAAGLGVPVVGIFLATAQPWDTGPYAEGSLSLEPDMPCHPCEFGTTCPRDHACRQRIPVETVLAACRARLEASQPAVVDAAKGARIWRAVRDGHGFMSLVCLSGHERDDRSQWVLLQRHVYRHFLDQQPLPPLPRSASLSPAASGQARETLQAAEQLLTLMQQQAALLGRAPREPLKKKFLGVWQRVQALFSKSEQFNVLAHVFAVESQESGQNVASLERLAGRYLGLVQAWKQLLPS